MGILPGVSRVMAAPHFWPYGRNQTKANVPAVSSIIRYAVAHIPDGSDPATKTWQRINIQIPIVVLQFTNVACW